MLTFYGSFDIFITGHTCHHFLYTIPICLSAIQDQIRHLNKIDRNQFPEQSCPKGYEWDIQDNCVNTNECVATPYPCGNAMCLDYSGSYMCYNSYLDETKMCHHESTSSNLTEIENSGPLCECYSTEF